MKKNVFKLLLLFPVILFAQQIKPDSSLTKERPMNFSIYFNPLTHLNDQLLLEQFEYLNLDTALLSDTSSIWMKTRFQMAYMNSPNNNDVKANILNPLYKQYAASQNMKLLKQILGAVQLGAVGILAYQHIKKYGFLKKKENSD